MKYHPDESTVLELTRNSWQTAVALIKLMRSGDRAAAMGLIGHMDVMELEYTMGSLAAVANAAFETASDVTHKLTGKRVDVDAYLDGIITGLAARNAEQDAQSDDGQCHD